eukprot:CAMPEP_0115312434 /NCGR_PEP_ID=MMETSP0270-20121206/75896_1 /TAXON_ID=71861 /ORGANISM="Scrippsiella trochoidea, Strain CCMP3099" /LENGTH=238 /DNA_ID=CAMNT_0002731391 /DNA_START=38 /DNA_END=756 /DNA_ORIENTATION=+
MVLPMLFWPVAMPPGADIPAQGSVSTQTIVLSPVASSASLKAELCVAALGAPRASAAPSRAEGAVRDDRGLLSAWRCGDGCGRLIVVPDERQRQPVVLYAVVLLATEFEGLGVVVRQHLQGRVVEGVHGVDVQIHAPLRQRLIALHDDGHLLTIKGEVVIVLNLTAVGLEGHRVWEEAPQPQHLMYLTFRWEAFLAASSLCFFANSSADPSSDASPFGKRLCSSAGMASAEVAATMGS